MALQRSLLLCGLLWWQEGVALGPPSPAVSRFFPSWEGARPRNTDPPPNRLDPRGYHPHHSDRGSSQPESSFWNIQVNREAYGRRPEYGRSENQRSYRITDQNDRQEAYDRNEEPQNRHNRKEYNYIRNRAFLERGDENFSFQRQNNERYDGNVRRNDKTYVERMFTSSDLFRRRNEVVNDDNQRRNYAPKEDSHSPYSRQQGQTNSFNGGRSYTPNNVPANPRLTTPRYHFIESAKTGRDSNVMHHHQQSSSNERHFRFLSDGFRGPISSGHYEDVPGTSGSYYRRPGGLTNNYNDVTSSHQPKAPRPLLQSNQVWPDQVRDEVRPHRDNRSRNPRNQFPERAHGGYHESYSKRSETNDRFGSDRHKISALQLQEKEQLKIPIQPHLIVKEEELPNPQPLDTSSHHPYSLLYFHYIPHRNSS